MYDYELRKRVIESGLVSQVKQISKRKWDNRHDDEALMMIKYEALFIQAEDPEAYAEAERVASADFKRNWRLSNRIKSYISMGNSIFLTLTFRDDVLEKITEETRRRYVTRFLKEECKYYIANIDYGSTTDREHYHAVCVPWCTTISLGNWKYGYAYANHIRAERDSLRLAKYCTKLCNHAIKKSTKRNRVIYSKVDWAEYVQDKNAFYKPPEILCNMRLVLALQVNDWKQTNVHPFT